MESCYIKIIKRFQEKRFSMENETVDYMVAQEWYTQQKVLRRLPGIRFIVFLQGCWYLGNGNQQVP